MRGVDVVGLTLGTIEVERLRVEEKELCSGHVEFHVLRCAVDKKAISFFDWKSKEHHGIREVASSRSWGGGCSIFPPYL